MISINPSEEIGDIGVHSWVIDTGASISPWYDTNNLNNAIVIISQWATGISLLNRQQNKLFNVSEMFATFSYRSIAC